MNKSVLIFGGDKDFNVTRFLNRISSTSDIEIIPCIFGQSGDPSFTYDLQNKGLYINNKEIKVDSVFLRYDVFSFLDTGDEEMQRKSSAFYTAFLAWLNDQEKVKVLNKNYYKSSRTNKITALKLAQEHGFAVPETYVSNDMSMLEEKLNSKKYIYKELEGGSYTEEIKKDQLDSNLKPKADYPFFIQEKLIQPEIRVFRVVDSYFSFKMISDSLDYRANNNVKIEYIETSDELREKVKKVTDALNLNYSALDLKTHEETGELMFLEANSQAMFAAFDEHVDFAITDSMINYLIDSHS